MEIIYLPMPISVEQKKEYNRMGYRVVDAEFAPEGYELPENLVALTGFAADIDVVPVYELLGPLPEPRRRRRRNASTEE